MSERSSTCQKQFSGLYTESIRNSYLIQFTSMLAPRHPPCSKLLTKNIGIPSRIWDESDGSFINYAYSERTFRQLLLLCSSVLCQVTTMERWLLMFHFYTSHQYYLSLEVGVGHNHRLLAFNQRNVVLVRLLSQTSQILNINNFITTLWYCKVKYIIIALTVLNECLAV